MFHTEDVVCVKLASTLGKMLELCKEIFKSY